jgi:hypothetical protein
LGEKNARWIAEGKLTGSNKDNAALMISNRSREMLNDYLAGIGQSRLKQFKFKYRCYGKTPVQKEKKTGKKNALENDLLRRWQQMRAENQEVKLKFKETGHT